MTAPAGPMLVGTVEEVRVKVIVRNPPRPGQTGGVAWDVDATLWDFVRGFYDAARAAHPHLPERPPEGEDLWRYVVSDVGLDAARLLLPDLYRPEVMARYGALPGAAAATHAVREAGGRVVIMTFRPPEAATGTARFLDDAGIHWDELRCGYDCKITACVEMGVRVIVDDRPETLDLAVSRGLHALTLRWPHNRHACRHPVVHADDYAGLLPAILAALASPPTL